ncbi:hypothetical protein IEQ34_006158 [Dendrobium chrysotoxum]|uniref:Uncharacterized protein n=1 Tax=Dendrobium chrysotoxum TaxID=161865 RepID=A0AAV7HF56_DENCH|nr:hypothetical protein IEQ34_006158 [Dendrobium chrysotoxum]
MDYSFVFYHRSYYVCNYYIKLIKWPPIFDILVESPICSYMNLFIGTTFAFNNASTVGYRPSVMRVVKNDFLVFSDHCKTLVHSKHESYHLNSCLKKISSSKSKFVDAAVTYNLSAQTVGVPNEFNKNIIKTNCKPPTEGNSVPTNPLIQATPNVVIDLANPYNIGPKCNIMNNVKEAQSGVTISLNVSKMILIKY